MPFGQDARENLTTIANNTSGSQQVCVAGLSDLWIKKEILTGRYVEATNEYVVYRITYGNSGSDVTSGFTITDVIPDIFQFTSFPGKNVHSLPE